MQPRKLRQAGLELDARVLFLTQPFLFAPIFLLFMLPLHFLLLLLALLSILCLPPQFFLSVLLLFLSLFPSWSNSLPSSLLSLISCPSPLSPCMLSGHFDAVLPHSLLLSSHFYISGCSSPFLLSLCLSVSVCPSYLRFPSFLLLAVLPLPLVFLAQSLFFLFSFLFSPVVLVSDSVPLLLFLIFCVYCYFTL